jgi:hypothetical protein
MQASSSLTTKEKIQFGLLGIVVLGGAVMIGRSMIRKAQSNTEERKTYEDGSAAAIAKQIRMAFENDGWWGTDKDKLREAIRSVPSKGDFEQVMASYQRLYNSTLMRDMQEELKTTEYSEMLAILAAKPDKTGNGAAPQIGYNYYVAWAKRLNAAFNIYYGIIPGTDEAAIKAVFLEIPTQAAYAQVAAVYQTMYGIDLKTELQSELELWEYQPMMQLITSKPTT